jgi:hypothetical protein
MAKPKNHRESWDREDLSNLKKLAKENAPTRVIGLKLQRTENAVRAKAADEGISLKPTNQRPYNRRNNK